jgi:hypothetical protein
MSIPTFPPTVQAIDLEEWNAEAKGMMVYVWVDPPRAMLKEREAFRDEIDTFFDGLTPKADPEKKPEADPKAKPAMDLKAITKSFEKFKKTLDPRIYAWYAKMWSYGPEDGMHPSVDEIEQMNEANPNFLTWLKTRTGEVLDTYRGAEKKS